MVTGNGDYPLGRKSGRYKIHNNSHTHTHPSQTHPQSYTGQQSFLVVSSLQTSCGLGLQGAVVLTTPRGVQVSVVQGVGCHELPISWYCPLSSTHPLRNTGVTRRAGQVTGHWEWSEDIVAGRLYGIGLDYTRKNVSTEKKYGKYIKI